MELDNMKISDLKNIYSALNLTGECQESNPYTVGDAYLIRTVTHINIGIIVKVGKYEIVIKEASWIPDTGRYHVFLRDGVNASSDSEVEPYPVGAQVVVGRGAVVDACKWNHALPTETK